MSKRIPKHLATNSIEIKCPDISSRNAVVKLDGKDITPCLKRVFVTLDADKANNVELHVLPSKIDIDIDAFVKIEKEASVGDKKRARGEKK